MEGMANDALWLVAWVAAPLLGALLAVAVVIGFVQAFTQNAEPALSFVPKLVAVVAVLALLGGWMGDRLVDFARDQLTQIDDRLE